VDDPPLSPDRPLAGTNRTNTANIAFCIITAFALCVARRFLRFFSVLTRSRTRDFVVLVAANCSCDYAWCFLLSVDSAVVPLER